MNKDEPRLILARMPAPRPFEHEEDYARRLSEWLDDTICEKISFVAGPDLNRRPGYAAKEITATIYGDRLVWGE